MNASHIASLAKRLVTLAKIHGVHLTITTESLKPPAMGNYEMAVEAREARTGKLPARMPSYPLSEHFESALYELIDKICPGLDTGDLLADARTASAALDADSSTVTAVPWDVAQAICDTPAVDSAIRNLLDDNTGDNATCMVRAIIDAYIPGDSRAMADVVAERCRQIDQEGWGRSHDDAHQPGALAAAASRYSTNAAACLGIDPPCLSFGTNWPWDESWFKPTTPRRDLVKAAALIIAEIEREDRQMRPVQGSQA